MKQLVLLMVVLAFCVQCTEGRLPSDIDSLKPADTETTAAQPQNGSTPTASGGADAQRAFIDPETGEFVPPPAHDDPAASTARPPSALSHPVVGIEEEASPVPGGGVMIDLKGQFHNPFSMTNEGSGHTSTEHPASQPSE